MQSKSLLEKTLKIFFELNNSDVKYAVVRNFPKKNTKTLKEVDMLVFRKDFYKTEKVLKKNGFYRIFSGPFPGHQILCKLHKNENLIQTFDLHVGGLTRDGILYFSEKDFLVNLKKNNGYFVPGNEEYKKGLILHSVLDKKYFKVEYKKVLKGQDFEKLLEMRWRVLTRSIISYPRGLINYFLIFWKRVRMVLNPTYWGPLIAFIGPDGSGKSTTIEKFREAIESGFVSHEVYMGWRGGIIPFIPRLMRADQNIFSKRKKSGEIETKSVYKNIRSLGISLLYFLELYLRYLVRIIPKRKMGFTVVTDRYFYDRIALDKDMPSFVKWLFEKLMPKPDLTYCLHADPKILANREKDLSKEELKSQYVKFMELSDRYKITKLDNSKNHKMVLRRVLTDYFERVTIQR